MREALWEQTAASKAEFITKVYGVLSFCLVVGTGITAYAVENIKAFAPYANMAGITLLVLMFGSLFVRQVKGLNTLLLGATVTLSSIMIAPLIWVHTQSAEGMQSLVMASAVTGLIFAGLTAYVKISGKSFTFMGGFLFMVTLAMIIVGLILCFFSSTTANLLWSAVGVLLFSGWILYDTSAVVEIHYPENDVAGAVLSLYLDILNLFLHLLRLFGVGNSSSDD